MDAPSDTVSPEYVASIPEKETPFRHFHHHKPVGMIAAGWWWEEFECWQSVVYRLDARGAFAFVCGGIVSKRGFERLAGECDGKLVSKISAVTREWQR